MSIVCPYCGCSISKELKRKTLCKSCSKPIFVRTDLFGQRVFVTTEQRDKIDQERNVFLEARKYIEMAESLETIRRYQLRDRKDIESSDPCAFPFVVIDGYAEDGLCEACSATIGTWRRHEAPLPPHKGCTCKYGCRCGATLSSTGPSKTSIRKTKTRRVIFDPIEEWERKQRFAAMMTTRKSEPIAPTVDCPTCNHPLLAAAIRPGQNVCQKCGGLFEAEVV